MDYSDYVETGSPYKFLYVIIRFLPGRKKSFHGERHIGRMGVLRA